MFVMILMNQMNVLAARAIMAKIEEKAKSDRVGAEQLLHLAQAYEIVVRTTDEAALNTKLED